MKLFQINRPERFYRMDVGTAEDLDSIKREFPATTAKKDGFFMVSNPARRKKTELSDSIIYEFDGDVLEVYYLVEDENVGEFGATEIRKEFPEAFEELYRQDREFKWAIDSYRKRSIRTAKKAA